MPTSKNIEKLKEFSGGKWDKFLDNQEDVINNLLAGKNTLAIMPTGSGKSLCYQLPVFMGLKPAIVISPLISLMRDQFESLLKSPLKSDYLNSSKSFVEQMDTLDLFTKGSLDILFVSPERLADRLFFTAVSKFAKIKPCFFVVDEAHCITEWGHDFRTDYMEIPSFIRSFKNTVTLAMTATASSKTRQEIMNVLNIGKNNVFIADKVFKDNLEIDINSFNTVEEKEKYLDKLLHDYPKPGIVYTNGRATAEKLADKYSSKYKTAYFHSEVDPSKKNKLLKDFRDGKIDVLFATNAFGMGIDIKAIRFIIHYRVPFSIDQFVQEIGRAGRDGEKAYCSMFYTKTDEGQIKRQIKSTIPDMNKLSNFLYHAGPFPVYEMPMHNAEIQDDLSVDFLCKYRYLAPIGETCTEITCEPGSKLKGYQAKDDIININATARATSRQPHVILENVYEDFFNNRIKILARSNMHYNYAILKDTISLADLKAIENDLADLQKHREDRFESLKNLIDMPKDKLKDAINKYFK